MVCLSYQQYRSVYDPAVFVIIEEWRTRADQDAHMQTPHVAEAFSIAGKHIATPPVIRALAPVKSERRRGNRCAMHRLSAIVF